MSDELELPNDGDFAYFVATAAQQRVRRSEFHGAPIRPPQRQIDVKDGPVLYFPTALRALIAQDGRDVARRLDERLAVRRALRRVAGTDDTRARQLFHDLRLWESALRDAALRGIALDDPDLYIEINDPNVAQTLRELQLALRGSLEAPIFEAAARAYVAEAEPPRRVVLDGFTFLTPLQRFLISTWSETATVDLVFPYRSQQQYGFAAMRETYREWWDERQPGLRASEPAETRALDVVQRTFLGPLAPQSLIEDESICLHEFGHRQHEVESCVTEIKRAVEEEAIAPEDIAVVVLDLAGYRPLLAEEAERQGVSVTITVPPRLLLLTPVGRFVLGLYSVWDTEIEGLRMEADAFEEMLASGWLGSRAKGTLDRFRLVRRQAFARCEGEDDWHDALVFLDNLNEGRGRYPETSRPDSREPALAMDAGVVAIWAEAIQTVVELSRALFTEGERSISDHIQRLLEALEGLPTGDLHEIERDVISRLQEALRDQSDTAVLEMDAEEFGTLLNALASERDDAGDHRAGEDPEIADDPPSDQIWITTLRGIDGVSRRRVFLLGVDDRRMPMPYEESWPFPDSSIGEHIASERYLFLAALRASEEKLWLSFSRSDPDGTVLPSMYASLLADQFGLTISNPSAESLGDTPVPELRPPVPVERESYAVADLSHFGLCPFRYKLERLDPDRRAYTSSFQLRLLAGSVWFDLACAALENRRHRAHSKRNLIDAMKTALTWTRPVVRARFPGLTGQDAATLERHLSRTIEQYSIWFDHWGSSSVFLAADDDEPRSVDVDVRGRDVRIDANSLRHVVVQSRGQRRTRYPIWDDLFLQEWLVPSSEEESATPPAVDGIPLFPSRKEAFAWYKNRALRSFYVAAARDEFVTRSEDLISGLERGAFPRNPGHQCHFCSAIEPCLGQRHPGEVLLEEASAGFEASTDGGFTDAVGSVDLTDQQRAIVERVRSGGVTVVSAGAGSGKTHTMVASVVDLIDQHGANLDEFVLITFTNKAADELRARLRASLEYQYREAPDDAGRRVWLEQVERIAGAHVGTIHAFCGRILREFGYGMPIPRSARRTLSGALFHEALVAATDDAFSGRSDVDRSGLLGGSEPILARVLWDAHLLHERVAELVDHCRRIGVELGDMLNATKAQPSDEGKPYRLAFAELVSDAHERYEARKARDGIVDAHDLLLRTHELVTGENGPSVAEAVAMQHRYLFVDEFQDTDPIQAAIIRTFEPLLKAMLLVGDLKQSIYGFRSAEPALLESFASDFHRKTGENGRPLPLNIARRPTRQLLDLQNAFFAFLGTRGYAELADPLQAEETPLEPAVPLTPLIVDPGQDAATIAEYIRALLGKEIETRSGKRPLEPGDIAILARTNWRIQRIAHDVTRELDGDAVVFDDTGGLFYKRPEIVSTYRMLRLLLEEEDDAVLSLALETPYLDSVDAAEIEAALLGDRDAADVRLVDWFRETHPELAARLHSIRDVSRRDPVTEVIARLYNDFEIRQFYAGIGHARAMRNLEKFRDLARRLYREEQALTLRAFVDYVGEAIVQGWGEHDAGEEALGEHRPPYVRALTIHRAKGLQFPIVILPGANAKLINSDHDPPFIVLNDQSLDASIPNSDDADTKTDLFETEISAGRTRSVAEEMRLLYVAITRAEQSVVVLGARPWTTEATNEFYSWGDEFRAARTTLEPFGARYLETDGPPDELR